MKTLIVALLLALASPAWATWYVFDGANTKVDVTQFAAINSRAFTWMAWMRFADAGEGSLARPVVHTQSDSDGWRISIVTTNDIRIIILGSTDADYQIAQPAADTMFHFAVAFDMDQDTVPATFWINGVVETLTSSTDGTVLRTPTEDLTIGNSADQTHTWNGFIGSAAYYNRVLTTNEVKQAMHRGPQTLDNGLICYWPLGAFGANSFAGSGGASCNGTATSATASGAGPRVSVPQGGLGH